MDPKTEEGNKGSDTRTYCLHIGIKDLVRPPSHPKLLEPGLADASSCSTGVVSRTPPSASMNRWKIQVLHDVDKRAVCSVDSR